MRSRELTANEIAVLRIIQEGYGAQNGVGEVFLNDKGEAVLFVKASDGTTPLLANLTSLAGWRADGTIPSDADLRGWLGLS